MKQILVEALFFNYEKEVILDGLTFEIEKGESVGFVGANGVGKSTLFRILMGLELDYQGYVEHNGVRVTRKNFEHIRKNGAYLFQNSDNQLFMPTVYEEVAFGLQALCSTEEELEQSVIKALQRFGLESRKDKQIYKMSGGEKKTTALAAILAMRPQTLLLDEPSNSLDPRSRKQLIGNLNDILETKLIASHDLDFVLDTCQRVIVLGDGKIVADGRCEEVLRNGQLLESSGLELPLCFKTCKKENKGE